MGLCVNPYCDDFCQPDDRNQLADHCYRCGATLTLDSQYRLTQLVKPLQQGINVFEAKDLSHTDQSVIIKLLDHPHISLRNQLKREYDFLLQMPPPFLQIGLDDYFEVQIHPDLPVVIYGLVLPKLEGMNSHEFIREHGTISVVQAVEWLQQLLTFVRVMHEHGYLHRDIKPSNILVHSDRTISLIDFGTVRKMDNNYLSIIGGHLETDTGQPQTLTRIISPGFSAPEQIAGLAVPQSDFFSMARTFVYWVTGEAPQSLAIAPDGKLTWPKLKDAGRSLKQYINNMMSTAVENRPVRASLIQKYFTVDWQRARRWQQLIASPWFRLWAGGCLVGLVVGSYLLLSFILSRFLFYRGSERIFDGQYQKAKKDLLLSLKIDPNFEEANHNMASLCQQIQDYDCALAYNQQAIKLNPDRWQSYYNLGGIWDNLNRLDQAKRAYEKAVGLSRSQAIEPLNNLARIEILMQKPDAAIARLQQAQTLSPAPKDLAVIYKNLGWAYLAQNQASNALIQLKKSQALNPNLADTYCLMAKLYDGFNQSPDANNNWIACMSLNSDAPEVFRWREDFMRKYLQEEQEKS